MKDTIEKFARSIAHEHWNQASDESKENARQWAPVGNDFDALAEELGMSDETDLSDAQIKRLEDCFAETISNLLSDNDANDWNRAIKYAAETAAREDTFHGRRPFPGRHLKALASALGIGSPGNLVGSDVKRFCEEYERALDE